MDAFGVFCLSACSQKRISCLKMVRMPQQGQFMMMQGPGVSKQFFFMKQGPGVFKQFMMVQGPWLKGMPQNEMTPLYYFIF